MTDRQKLEKEINHVDLNAVIYLEEKDNKFLAKGYSGKKSKPDFYFNFKNETQRQVYVDKWLNDLKVAQEAKKERAIKRKTFVHGIKMGDIFYCSWGYDQTNIDFYQVTEIIGKNTVKLRQLLEKDVGNNQGHFMSATKIALKDEFLTEEKEITKRISPSYDNRPYIKLSSFEYAYIWDGTPKNYSWYA